MPSTTELMTTSVLDANKFTPKCLQFGLDELSCYEYCHHINQDCDNCDIQKVFNALGHHELSTKVYLKEFGALEELVNRHNLTMEYIVKFIAILSLHCDEISPAGVLQFLSDWDGKIP